MSRVVLCVLLVLLKVGGRIGGMCILVNRYGVMVVGRF